MIRHNIIFKVKNGVSDEDIYQALEGFRQHEQTLNNVFSIIGDSCRFLDEKSVDFFMHNVARGATHCISIDFFDHQALDDFFNNADLLAAKEAIVAITASGYDGIVGFDLENPVI